jgi:hypothetical protein
MLSLPVNMNALLLLLLLQSEMEGGRLTWLLANTLCERTYLARRRVQA